LVVSATEQPDLRAAQQYALAQGLRDTRSALERWRAAPGPVLGGWFGGALLVSIGLLGAVWLVSRLSTPDPTWFFVPGVTVGVGLDDYAHVLGSNMLVLALHATACVAGFMAGSSLPLVSRDMTGVRRWVHEKAGPIAIAWVIAVTTFSLFAQAFALGFDGATLATQLGIDSWLLIVTVLPHALPELTAIFLPLAAWLIASRRGEWSDLLAATFVTVAIAVPMLLASALVELYLWPVLLRSASPVL
jgi:hypothetical protein